ncbi:MAG: inositol monophosphatase family protein, partial [Actinomycetota bacterium]
LVEGIVAVRPHDAIEGEEGTSRPGSSNVTWHLDPIDGTTNYVYGVPAFSVSVAAAVDDDVVAGVVVDPSLGIVYRAVAGGGATANGAPLRCSDRDTLATALLATGFSYRAERRRVQAEVLVELLPVVRDIRRFGSAALDLCAVAAGRVDAYYETGLNRWDLAAGALIAAEAGAVVENLSGGRADRSATLAAPPGLFPALRDRLVAIEGTTEH